ncbi:MAG: STAS domain-containing protein [Pseudomonadota bacterium]
MPKAIARSIKAPTPKPKRSSAPKAGVSKQTSVKAPRRKAVAASQVELKVVDLAESEPVEQALVVQELVIQELGVHDPIEAASNDSSLSETTEVASMKKNSKAPKNEPARVQLPARLQINNLDGLYAELCSLVTSKKPHVIMDAGDISLVDSAGVQLLVAFFRSFQAGGGKIEWDNYSVQLYQMADELGISGQLGG